MEPMEGSVSIARLQHIMDDERAATDEAYEKAEKVIDRAQRAGRHELNEQEQHEHNRHQAEKMMHKYAYHLLRELIEENL
jgi:hypothetical protein